MIDRLKIQPLSFMEDWTQRFMRGVEDKKADLLKLKCDENNLPYSPDRIVMLMKVPGKAELYYYQMDSGALSPLVAISDVSVSYDEDDIHLIRVRAEFVELGMSIFLPYIQPV